VIEHTKTAC